MTLTGGVALPAVAGAVLVCSMIGLNVARFRADQVRYHIQSATWALFLVGIDLLHLVVHERAGVDLVLQVLFFVALVLFVVSLSGVIRLSAGWWYPFALEAWIVGAAVVLTTWAVSGLAGASSTASLLDVAHVAVTAWVAICVFRQIRGPSFRAVGWWYGSVSLRCVAVLALALHHVGSGPESLTWAAMVLLAASYLTAMPAVWADVGYRVEQRRPANFWQAPNVPYAIVILAAPVVMAGLTVEDNAKDPFYLVLIGSVGVALCLRTMLEGDRSRALLKELTARSEELHELAFSDPLTGLANRNRVVAKLSELIGRSRAGDVDGEPYVLYLDLDGFKRVNDAAGHEAGDSVLRDVAGRLREATPDRAFLGRLGGDEFVVVLDDVTLADARGVAIAVVDAITKSYAIAHGSFVVGASIGIAASHDATDAEDLLRHGDLAMYAAKRERVSLAVYAEQMHESAVRRAEDDRMYSGVLDDQRLEMRYQPIIDLETGALASCEALLRWRTHDGELRVPAGLLEFAQRSGQLADLSTWTIGTALSQAAVLRERFDGLSVSVNLAPVELMRPNLVAAVRDELAARDLPPEVLTLEITEQVLIEEPDRVIRILADLRASRIRVAIDDFGTGFSSLAYLVDLPVDVIKLDQSFVHTLPRHSSARIVIAGVVDMADKLGLELVAEGVETVEQAELLAGLGCRYCQGSQFYAPMTADELAAIKVTASATG